jgi:DUF2075 family protein
MTSFRVEHFRFAAQDIRTQAGRDPRFSNWPVVYALDGNGAVYVGESLNAAARLRQHLETQDKRQLQGARVVIDETFNKSVCLDLESYLIRLLAGDGRFQVLNRNEGITNANYYGRDQYQATFRAIFDALLERGLFTRPIRDIENSDLFKLSPFKALSPDQAIAIDDILTGLFDDLAAGRSSRIVIQGDPGTGKTVVGIYLMKLLSDIKNADLSEPSDSDSILSEFFVPGYPELLTDFNVGLVIPQQSLRKSIERVFRQTPGLSPSQVLTPFQVGKREDQFDLLIVDEAHRLNQRANQAAGPLNTMYRDINIRLFGEDDPSITQLDWIDFKSRHQLYLVDGAQSVRPADLPASAVNDLVSKAKRDQRHYGLTSQMRVRAGQDYVAYVRGVLDGSVGSREEFPGYDLRMYDDLGEMRSALAEKENEAGLARLLAGYAWKWVSKNDPDAIDINLDGLQLQWNSTDTDWVNTPTSVNEVGSIHTIQGYDLNYAGVIVGPDLRYDVATGHMVFDRRHYHDPRGTTNNRLLGITYTDDDILQFVRNIYAVLLTRGVRGTYVYVCDASLRRHMRQFF